MTLSQIRTWLSGLALTFTDTLTVNKAAASGVESLQVWKVSDDAVAKLEVTNGSSTDGQFMARLRADASGTNVALQSFGYITTDTGTNPAFSYQARTLAAAALATRPVAAWDNLSTRLMTLWPSGLLIGSSTSTAAATKVEVQDANNSQISFGTAADCGALYASTTMAEYVFGARMVSGSGTARQTASAKYRQSTTGHFWYFNTGLTIGNAFTSTEIMQANGTGLGVLKQPGCAVDAAGTIRSTSAVNPTSGTGCEMLWSGSSGQVVAVDRATTTYKDLSLIGDIVRLRSGTTTALTAQSTKVSADLPFIIKSYTWLTKPAASVAPDGLVVITDTARGRRLCISNGTDYLYVEDTAVASA